MKRKGNLFLLLFGLLVLSCTPQAIETEPNNLNEKVNPDLSDTGDDTDTHPDNDKDADE